MKYLLEGRLTMTIKNLVSNFNKKSSTGDYIIKAMDRSIEKEMKQHEYRKKKQNIALIGLRPHAKRI